jgi:hypothetical protein
VVIVASFSVLKGHDGPPGGLARCRDCRGWVARVRAGGGELEDLVEPLAAIETISRQRVSGGLQLARAIPVSERPRRHAQEGGRLADRQIVAELRHCETFAKLNTVLAGKWNAVA